MDQFDVYPIIGMSPGNSYFTEDIIKQIISTVTKKYGESAILIPDIPAISTYVALGYQENRARRDKAIPKGNNLKNKSIKAINDLGLTAEQVKIVDWENEVSNDPIYKKKYDQISQLYSSNETFAEAADNATKSVLENMSKSIPEIDSAIKIAVSYLLQELAFMEFAPQHFKAKKVIYIYHKNWPVYEAYIAGKLDGTTKPYLGYEIHS